MINFLSLDRRQFLMNKGLVGRFRSLIFCLGLFKSVYCYLVFRKMCSYRISIYLRLSFVFSRPYLPLFSVMFVSSLPTLALNSSMIILKPLFSDFAFERFSHNFSIFSSVDWLVGAHTWMIWIL